jgi:3-keto-disaccharide hydrolase
MDRPRPPVVDPGPERPPVAPPADAIVLFDGRSLAEWQSGDSQPARWQVRDGYMEVVRGTGSIRTRRSFGDVQVHIEWATPTPPTGSGQERGNSGVFLMSYYEIQVLDSYQNDTYADGQAAAMYGQMPPLVNACRPPGRWQTYDIVFRRPRFGPDGSVVRPARVTVIHNGVVVHDAVPFAGRTAHARPAQYQPHPERLPISLQDHGDPVRYRNVWVRELPEEP